MLLGTFELCFIIIFVYQKRYNMYIRILLLSIILITGFIFPQNTSHSLTLDENFPLWLKSGESRSDQTSGITFIKSDGGIDYFLLADDIGDLHLLSIKADKILSIEKIEFVNETQNFFATFPKKDFEEVAYDKETGELYLSVEGNGEYYNDFLGIFKLIFKNRDIFSKQVISIIRVNFRPQNLFFKYTAPNVGYEGFSFDNNFFYLGLEGFQKDNLFADSALVFIANRTDMQIIKTISTKQYGIYTICGLYSDQDYSLWGVDRNNRKIFHFIFDKNFNVTDFESLPLTTEIPGFKELNYLPSFESITFDDKNNVYVVDDPWKQVFVPEKGIFEKLDENTKLNFKNYIPTIFKYKITPKGDK